MTVSLKNSSQMFVYAVVAMTALFFVVVAGTTFFLTTKQDELASHSSEKLMQMGIAGVQQDLEIYAHDYSLWTEALNNIRARNLDWVYESMASTVSTGGFDLFAILYPSGDQIGWMAETEDQVVNDVFDDVTVNSLRQRTTDIPFFEVRSFHTRIDDEIWLLTEMNAQPLPVFQGDFERADYPLLVYGKRIDDALVASLGETILLDDVTLLADPTQADPSRDIILHDAAGAPLAAITWNPPTPGTTILKQLYTPALVISVLVLIITWALGRFIVLTARRLKQAMEDAQEADRAKSVLLANVSHELRTPMNGIMGAAQLLQDSEVDPDDRELLDVIERSAAEQLDLIEHLIQVARIDSGDQSVRREPVVIDSLLGFVIAMPRQTAEQKGLTLTYDTADLPVVMSDARLLRQSVTNLLGNAIKFTEKGAIDVTARWSALNQHTGHLTITVSDTGIGVAKADQDRIFERFQQADGSTERNFGGTGLGLSITKSLIESLNGTISVESKPGEGSRFTISVPCQNSDSIAKTEMKEAA